MEEAWKILKSLQDETHTNTSAHLISAALMRHQSGKKLIKKNINLNNKNTDIKKKKKKSFNDDLSEDKIFPPTRWTAWPLPPDRVPEPKAPVCFPISNFNTDELKDEEIDSDNGKIISKKIKLDKGFEKAKFYIISEINALMLSIVHAQQRKESMKNISPEHKFFSYNDKNKKYIYENLDDNEENRLPVKISHHVANEFLPRLLTSIDLLYSSLFIETDVIHRPEERRLNANDVLASFECTGLPYNLNNNNTKHDILTIKKSVKARLKRLLPEFDLNQDDGKNNNTYDKCLNANDNENDQHFFAKKRRILDINALKF